MENELKLDAKIDLPIRQNLVDTALTFLLNPNVNQRPNEDKIAFLKKKGLTDSEISEAFNRVHYEAVSNGEQQMLNAYPLPPYSTPNSFGYFLRSFSSTFISLIVTVYLVHPLYKYYIKPWLFGSNSGKSEITELKEQLKDLQNSVSRLTCTVASLEETVTRMHHPESSSLYEVEMVPKTVRDVLEEVSNVKGLLLNRFSFPAPPAIAGAPAENKTQSGGAQKVVTIPKWQLQESEKEKSSEDHLNKESEVKAAESNSLSDVEDQSGKPEAHLTQDSSMELEVQKEEAKVVMQKRVEDVEERTPDEDSGSRNHLSDSPSSSLNGHCESAKDTGEN